MAVQLKGLKVFCDVVSQRSFSRAADENGISQSGASQLVQQLEEGLGVKLLDRSKRPFVLTPEGEVYYEGCREVVERYFAVEDRVRRLHEEVAGRVRVASIYSVGLHHMNRCLQEFLSQHPKANVRLEYLHPDRVYQAVEEDVADLGLVSYPKSSRSIHAVAWREEPMVLVCAPGHPLGGRRSVRLKELDGMKVVGFDSDLTIRREIDRVLELHQAAVHVVMEFDNIETIKRAIEIDAGAGLLPEPTVLREVQSGTLLAVPLETDELVRPLGIIHRRGKELSSVAVRFIELLQRQARTSESRMSGIEVAHGEPGNVHVNVHSTNGHRRQSKNELVTGDVPEARSVSEGKLPEARSVSEGKLPEARSVSEGKQARLAVSLANASGFQSDQVPLKRSTEGGYGRNENGHAAADESISTSIEAGDRHEPVSGNRRS